MEAFSIRCATAFGAQNVRVEYRGKEWAARYSATDKATIEANWSARMQKAQDAGQCLYDSDLFRLHSVIANDEMVHLHLGDTSYKEYVTTRHPACSMERADPIGTGIIITTVDGFIPVGHRSPSAEVNPGYLFTFGGFFERSVDIDPDTGQPNPFRCVMREVYEETGLALSMEHLTCLGIVYDEKNCHPELSFLCSVPLTKSELATLNWRHELSDLSFVPVKTLDSFIDQHKNQMVDSLVGGFHLFKMRRS